LLTRGGTLIREPCESCNGVQIQFGNKLTCINCGNTREIEKKNDTISSGTSGYDKGKYRPTHDASLKLTSDTYENDFHDRLCTSVKQRILDLIPELKTNKSISEELTKAQLIEIYLRILDRFEKI
ncbi:MAG TPA: hypothetical protein VL854_01725, partial [Nitrososphaeraceae archaeon]|nr:hypothetical protein [Nitrososphaeraceae archaeon]